MIELSDKQKAVMMNTMHSNVQLIIKAVFNCYDALEDIKKAIDLSYILINDTYSMSYYKFMARMDGYEENEHPLTRRFEGAEEKIDPMVKTIVQPMRELCYVINATELMFVKLGFNRLGKNRTFLEYVKPMQEFSKIVFESFLDQFYALTQEYELNADEYKSSLDLMVVKLDINNPENYSVKPFVLEKEEDNTDGIEESEEPSVADNVMPPEDATQTS